MGNKSDDIPSYIGVLIIVLGFALLAAILFVPHVNVSDTVTQQIITIIAGLIGGFIGWQYGSSKSSAQKDATISAVIATPSNTTTQDTPKS